MSSDSIKMLSDHIEHAVQFERMAKDERNLALKADLEKQACAYRRLAARTAEKLGLPPPSLSEG